MGIASLELPRDVRICPVCRLPRNNAAASPSGFVCCYVCLFVHVRDHGVDPVSGMACKVEQIVKLYE
jgi:peroxin-12